MGRKKQTPKKEEEIKPVEKLKPRQISLFESSKRSSISQASSPIVMKVKNMKKLADFDSNIKYGPWLGISRTVRYNRAVRLGLNPPVEIGILLEEVKNQEVEVEESTYEGSIKIFCVLSII